MKIFLSFIFLLAAISPAFGQKQTRAVARFVEFGASASVPIANKSVRIMAGDVVYSGRTNAKGWLYLAVPCGKESQIIFGAGYSFAVPVEIPCGRSAGLGLFDWRQGDLVSDDMRNVDGCRLCQ